MRVGGADRLFAFGTFGLRVGFRRRDSTRRWLVTRWIAFEAGPGAWVVCSAIVCCSLQARAGLVEVARA